MKMQLALLLTLSLISTFTIIKQEESLRDVNWPFKVCGNGTWTMKSLTLSNIPSRVHDLLITARGVADSETELSTVESKVKMNGIQLDGQVMDFQKSLNPGDDFKYQMDLYLSNAPAGTYEFIFNYFDKAGEINGCWAFQFKLK